MIGEGRKKPHICSSAPPTVWLKKKKKKVLKVCEQRFAQTQVIQKKILTQRVLFSFRPVPPVCLQLLHCLCKRRWGFRQLLKSLQLLESKQRICKVFVFEYANCIPTKSLRGHGDGRNMEREKPPSKKLQNVFASERFLRRIIFPFFNYHVPFHAP